MTLDQYLIATGESAEEFGARCRPPIHRTAVWHYRNRTRSPTAERVEAIRKATGNKVRAEDLIRFPNGHAQPPPPTLKYVAK